MAIDSDDFSTRDGLPENVVSRILVDDADNFWLAGNRGVTRVARAALESTLPEAENLSSPPSTAWPTA